MKPFNVEIFDREMNCIANDLIDYAAFSYKEDYLSDVKNAFVLSLNNSIKNGHYIRIFHEDSNEGWNGIIVKIEDSEKQMKLYCKSLLSLFDHEAYIEIDEIKRGTVENYIDKLIRQEFQYTDDTFQRLPLPTTTYINSSTTDAYFDYEDTDDVYGVINLLNDLIRPAFRQNQILVWIAPDYNNKKFALSITKYDGNVETVEDDVHGYVSKNFNLYQSNDEVNKLTLMDNDNHDIYNYYLHASDYSYDSTNTDRIAPVVNKIVDFSFEEIATKKFFKEEDIALNTINKYLEYDQTLTNEQLGMLQDAFTIIFPIFREYFVRKLTKAWYKENVGFDYNDEDAVVYKDGFPIYSYDYEGSAKYIDVDMDDDDALQAAFTEEEHEWYHQNYTFDVTSYTNNISIANNLSFRNQYHGTKTTDLDIPNPTEPDYIAMSQNSAEDETYSMVTRGEEIFWWKNARVISVGQGLVHYFRPKMNPSFSHIHILLPYVVSVRVNQLVGIDPDTAEGIYSLEEYDGLEGRINYVVSLNEINEIIEDYKESPAYKQAYETYVVQNKQYIINSYVYKEFGDSKYKHSIELTAEANNYFSSFTIGTPLNIIHDGKVYNSIVTAREYKGGLTKLTFGNIRMDLTKILNMKGV